MEGHVSFPENDLCQCFSKLGLLEAISYFCYEERPRWNPENFGTVVPVSDAQLSVGFIDPSNGIDGSRLFVEKQGTKARERCEMCFYLHDFLVTFLNSIDPI